MAKATCWFCGSQLKSKPLIHSAKVKAGLNRARLAGKTLGKRPSCHIDTQKIIRLREIGKSWRKIAQLLEVPMSSARTRALMAGYKTGYKKYMEETKWLRQARKLHAELGRQIRHAKKLTAQK